MTLLICLTAAIIVTLVWYCNEKARNLKTGMLCYMYWGASIMWTVDAITEYINIGAEYFSPDIDTIINDSFLGLSAVILGLLIWTVKVIIDNPYKVIKK